MRILVHDFCGHAFTAQLARALADHHDLHYVHFAGFQTPKGEVEFRADDPAGFTSEGIVLDEPFAKYSFSRRFRQERKYGRLAARRIREWRPNVVISANTPLEPQAMLVRQCHRQSVPFVFWLQDIHSIAIARHVSETLPVIGRLIGGRYGRLERSLLAQSTRIICISEDFQQTLAQWRIAPGKTTVIRNWSPLENRSTSGKQNQWSQANGLADKFVFLYSGTLGLKHDPSLLLELARRFADDDRVRVVVLTEGPAAEWLREQKQANVVVLPFAAQEEFPQVLACADICVALLEAQAGRYSVPSKVLSYLCAGRPIIAAMPRANLAARIISENDAGIITDPELPDQLYLAADELIRNPTRRTTMGDNAAVYARREFDVHRIAARFEGVFSAALEFA